MKRRVRMVVIGIFAAALAPRGTVLSIVAGVEVSARTRAAGQEPAVLVVLRDGQTLVSLYRDGRLMGLPDRSPEATAMVTELLKSGTLQRPAVLAGLATSPPQPESAQAAAASGGATDSRGHGRAIPNASGSSGVAANTASTGSTGATNSLPSLDEPRPIAPAGVVVRDPRPIFRWRPQLHATGYRVTIRNERGTTVASSPLLPGTSWQSSQALAAGRDYSWTVDAEMPSRPASAHVPAAATPVRFRVIDTDAARQLDARLARAGRSNLLKGLAYTEAGVLDDAEAAFAALVADNAGSERMRSLLDQVRAMRSAP